MVGDRGIVLSRLVAFMARGHTSCSVEFKPHLLSGCFNAYFVIFVTNSVIFGHTNIQNYFVVLYKTDVIIWDFIVSKLGLAYNILIYVK